MNPEYFAFGIVVSSILTALVAGNNLSASVGTLIGSRIVSRNAGTLIGAAGFAIGLLIQGHSLSRAAAELFPEGQSYRLLAMLISLAIFLVASLTRSPLSLTMAMVGVSIGLSLRFGEASALSSVRPVVLMWAVAPLVSVAGAVALNRLVSGITYRDEWAAAAVIKTLLIISSFLTAITLGANTLGFIESMAGFSTATTAAMVLSIFTGCFFLSRGVIKRVGEEIYRMRYTNAFISLIVSAALVETATLFGIPLSNTQTLTSSVLGTALSYRYKAVYVRPFLIVIATWVLSPVTGMALGYLL